MEGSVPRSDGEHNHAHKARPVVALLGQPNVGKTTLFNALCGLRSQTANIPGTTVDARTGTCPDAHVIDLPGTWGLDLDQPEAEAVRECLGGHRGPKFMPDVLVIVLDAANLARGLHLAVQVLSSGRPCVVSLNMIDVAQRRGLQIDPAKLASWLGCEVVPTSARSRQGVAELRAAFSRAQEPTATLPQSDDAPGTGAWVDGVIRESIPTPPPADRDRFSDRLDAACTHPLLGVLIFMIVMGGVFWAIFEFAGIPMDLIELIFGHVGGWFAAILPDGAVKDLIVDGIVGGLAGTVVFLPQILILFFLISLLEDTGYLARAAFVMDRLLRRFGLPGQSFVPMLSAHACAIPAIMSARLVPDRRDRLAVILVAPFLSCSARLPVYVLLIGILFAEQPVLAGLVFVGAYALGIMAALLSALLARKTLLQGAARPMVLELPAYQWPSIRSAILTCWDRSWLFLRKAGTVILGMVIVLWWLSTYPKPPESSHTTGTGSAIVAHDDEAPINPMAWSFAGRIGQGVQPIFEPLGWDWQLSVGVMTSFAAREVFVSTMAVLIAGGDDTDDPHVLSQIANARRDDGQPMFTPASAASLLVFFVLAMQCLPTLAVTAREAGGWKWAALQFGWMSGVAWFAAWITWLIVTWSGG